MPGPRRLRLDELEGLVSSPLPESGWRAVTQEAVNAFAEATGDRQWIHVDPERAAAGPFGTTIAHGYFTLSLGPALLDEILLVEDASLAVNYGLNRVRFPSPVPVGSRVRARAALAAAERFDGGVQVVLELTFEVEGREKPACVAEAVLRYYA